MMAYFASPRYWPGVRAGNMIFTAGRVPLDKDGNVFAPNDAAAQTENIMEALQAILAEGGATLQDVVYVYTMFLYPEDMPAIHEVRRALYGRPLSTAYGPKGGQPFLGRARHPAGDRSDGGGRRLGSRVAVLGRTDACCNPLQSGSQLDATIA